MYSTLRTVTACLYTERERDLGPFLLVLVTFRIHLIAVDFCCFFYFLLFYCLPGDHGRVWIISTGIPGDERGVQGACRALQSFGAHSLCRRLPPLMPLFFSLFLSFSLGLALVWTLFLHTQLSTISVSGEDSRPKHQSGFVAQFHGGNSIHFQMEICSVFPSSRHAMYRPTHQRTVQIGFAFQFFFFSSLYLLKLRLFFFFFFKIEICGFPPQNAIAFISFLFFVKQERYQ